MVVFSSAAARATNVSGVEDSSDDEEPGEVIESAPPLKVGEEREINNAGLKKKLLKKGHGWESPGFGDEVTGKIKANDTVSPAHWSDGDQCLAAVHYVGALLDDSSFISAKEKGETVTVKLGHGEIANGLDDGIVTMKKGETALFTLPSHPCSSGGGGEAHPPNSIPQFLVELISWIPVVDVCKDGGIIKRILLKGVRDEQPGDLDEVKVKYQAALADGSIVARTHDEGIEFYIKDGHLCPAFTKVLSTMKKGEKAALTVQPQYAFGEHGVDATEEYLSVPSNAVLHIDLELVAFRPVIDVSGDANVLKKIMKEGEGLKRPKEGATVTVRYTGLLEDGTIFERKGFDGGSPFEFIIDEDQVVAGLDRAAATMKKGEIAILTVKPEFGFGSVEVKCDLGVVPASAILIYEVEMVDFTKEKESFEMDGRERIEAAEKKKEEGNKLFKIGKYWKAAKRYDKAADCVSEESGYGHDEQKLAKSLGVSCWLNHAACSLKLEDFREAVRLCSKVLNVESHNIKALFRRAQAYIEMSDLDLAELDIKKALEVDPENREVKLMQKQLKQLQVENNKRDAKLYSNMFCQMRTDSKMESKRIKIDRTADERKEEAEAMEVDQSEVSSVATHEGMLRGPY